MLRPKTWEVLTMAVEEGVALGYHRAHKHVDQPDEQQLRQAIEEAVMGCIAEWFDVVEPGGQDGRG